MRSESLEHERAGVIVRACGVAWTGWSEHHVWLLLPSRDGGRVVLGRPRGAQVVVGGAGVGYRLVVSGETLGPVPAAGWRAVLTRSWSLAPTR